MNSNTTVYRSSRIESLAGKLAEQLRKPGDPFEQPLILVPNGNLRKWLKLELTRENKATAGLDIRFLETGLSERLFGREENRPLTDDSLALLINCLLTRKQPENSPLDPLYRYFTDSGTPDPSRRWQLSGQLARLFRDYGLHRHDYTDDWLGGGSAFGKTDNELTAAQAALYRDLFSDKGLVLRVNKERTDSGEAALNSLFCSENNSIPDDNKEIHVFGFSSISARHMEKLKELSTAVPVTFYFIAPETLPARKDAQEILAETRMVWGQASSGTDHLIKTSLDAEPHILRTKPEQKTLLGNLQTALNIGSAPDPAGNGDGTLTITGCPGIYREVEEVYNSIIHEMENDPDLELTDIAVLTTDIQEYLPPILSVFEGQDTGGNKIFFNLSDTSAYEESVYGQAILALLNIADGDLSRKDVFALIRNPAVQAGRKINEETADAWAAWTDGLNIFRTPDCGGKSWSFGLQRLRLSSIMNNREDNPGGFCDRQPWRDRNSDDSGSVARFSAFIDDLIRLYRILGEGPRTAASWKETIESMMDTFLAVPPERTAEIRVRLEIESALDNLTLSDTAAALAGIPPETSLSVVRDYLSGKLQGIPVTRGQYLTGGVTISSLLPMRPVPFKQIYILGLQEGKFPGTSNDSILDLRIQEKDSRPEDLTTPELNRALFLETLLCARKKLHLSFVNRDLQKDRDFFPCSTLNRLLSLLRTITDSGKKFPVCRAPLKGYSPKYIDKKSEDLLPNYSSRDRLLCLKRLEKQDLLKPEPDRKAMEDRTPARIEFEATSAEQDQTITVSLFQLQSFLKNPGKARLKRRIYSDIDPDEDSSVKTHPDLSSGYDVRDHLLNTMIETVFSGTEDPMPVLENHYRKLLSGGQLTPDGPFRSLDWLRVKRDFLAMLTGEKGLLEYKRRSSGKYSEFQAARLSGTDSPDSGSSSVFDIRLEPLLLDDGRTVRITGELPWVQRSGDKKLYGFLTRQYGSTAFLEYNSLLPVLFSSAFHALGPEPHPSPEIILLENDAVGTPTPAYPERINNNEFLKNLVADYLRDDAPEAMPLKGILDHLKQSAPDKKITEAHLHKVSGNFHNTFREYLDLAEHDKSGYDSWLELTDAEVPENAGEILIRRLLPLFTIHRQETDS